MENLIGDSNKFQILVDLKISFNTLRGDFSTLEKKKAQKLLNEFQKNNYINFIPILIQSKDEDLVCFGFQLLEQMIDFGWKTLLINEQNLLLGYIFRTVYERDLFNLQFNLFSFCSKKLNQCLIKIILKLEAIEIVLFLKNLTKEAKLSEFVCETNFSLLKLIFENMLLKENIKLKVAIQEEIQFSTLLKDVEDLTRYISEKIYFLIRHNASLILTSLDCLELLIKISPTSYCFDEGLFIFLVILCPQNITMNYSLKCLIELADRGNKKNYQLSTKIFMNFLIQFQEHLPITLNIGEKYKIFTQENKQFISSALVLFKSVFKTNIDLIETKKFIVSSFSLINQIIVKFSCIPCVEIYKNCLNWWLQIIDKNLIFYKSLFILNIIRKLFLDLRILLICRMIKPEEVLIRENENGQIVNEKVYDTESSEIYKKSKKIILFLANIDQETTQKIILKKLTRLTIPGLWNRSILNSICWTIGSISDIFNPSIASSKFFFVAVLKDLLSLCELKKEKKNKAIIASNIMFVVGQYSSFLKNHWKFCKTVIEKLFEFVAEPMDIPGFKDMACDTFLIIGRNCGEYISKDFYFERKVFLKWLFKSYSNIKNILQLRHKKQVLLSIAYIVNYNLFENDKKYFISKISLELNQELKTIPGLLELDLLENSIIYRQRLSFWIKVNIEILKILKMSYFEEFEYLVKDFYSLIRVISDKLLDLNRINSNFLDSSQGKTLYVIKKDLFEMLLQLILIFNKKKSSIVFDIYCCNVISPILVNYKNQSLIMFIDQLVLSFSTYLLQTIDFFQSLNSLRKLFKEIFISSIESRVFFTYNTKTFDFKIFKLLSALLIDQFKSLLKINSDPSISEKIFTNLMVFLSEGIGHIEESVCEVSINTLNILIELVTNTNLEKYFFLNYSEMFLRKLLICFFENTSNKSKKSIANTILNLIKIFRIFSDFSFFNNAVSRLFVTKTFTSTQNELYSFGLLFYTCQNNSLIKEKLKIYLGILDSSSNTNIISDKLESYSLSDTPINYYY